MFLDDIVARFTELTNKGKAPSPKSVRGSYFQSALAAHHESVVFRVDNISDFFKRVIEEKGTPAEDFFCVMPPYPKMWLEWKSDISIDDNRAAETQFGAALEAVHASQLSTLPGIPSDAVQYALDLERTHGRPEIYCLVVPHLRTAEGSFQAMDRAIFGVNGDGALSFSGRFIRLPWERRELDSDPLEAQKSNDSLVDNFLGIVLYTLQFCNCKNVVEELHSHPIALQRARNKRGKLPLVSFKTLDIRHIRRTFESIKAEHGVSGRVALHMCRGHFKDYRDKGLFGKNKGVYWWDAHIRGDDSNGTVVKDYNVHSDQEDGM